MKKLFYKLWILFLLSSCFIAQDKKSKKGITRESKISINEYISKIFPTDSIFKIDSFDLNGDGILDYALLLEHYCDSVSNESDTKCRKIAVVFGKENSYTIVAENDLIVNHNHGNFNDHQDPLREFKLENSDLIISEMYGANNKAIIFYTFKYNKKLNHYFLTKTNMYHFNILTNVEDSTILNYKDDSLILDKRLNPLDKQQYFKLF